MADKSATSDALKSLKKQLRDRSGDQRIFHVVVSLKDGEEKKEDDGPVDLHGDELLSMNSGAAGRE